jgi:hypothetical protein
LLLYCIFCLLLSNFNSILSLFVRIVCCLHTSFYFLLLNCYLLEKGGSFLVWIFLQQKCIIRYSIKQQKLYDVTIKVSKNENRTSNKVCQKQSWLLYMFQITQLKYFYCNCIYCLLSCNNEVWHHILGQVNRK